MDWRDRIVSDPDILVGKPVVKGTRLSVELILRCPAEGWTHDMLLESYPQLTCEDILAVLAFAADKMRQESYSRSQRGLPVAASIEALFTRGQRGR